MYYYIYKITNKINGNFYIGRRQCVDSIENDNYFGSGKRLKIAIKKYGKENFTKEVLHVCLSLEELILSEKTIVSKELLENTNCYNLAVGGNGGFTFYKNRVYNHTEEAKNKISKANSGRKRPDVSEHNKISLNKYWVGKKRSIEDRLKKSEKAKLRVKEFKTDFAIKIQCPYCNKIGQQANMKRWHFDKCKASPGKTA